MQVYSILFEHEIRQAFICLTIGNIYIITVTKEQEKMMTRDETFTRIYKVSSLFMD